MALRCFRSPLVVALVVLFGICASACSSSVTVAADDVPPTAATTPSVIATPRPSLPEPTSAARPTVTPETDVVADTDEAAQRARDAAIEAQEEALAAAEAARDELQSADAELEEALAEIERATQEAEAAAEAALAELEAASAVNSSPGDLQRQLAKVQAFETSAFLDPQRINEAIQLPSIWEELGGASLSENEGAPTPPLPPEDGDLARWCSALVQLGPRSEYASLRQWQTTDLGSYTSIYGIVSTYASAADVDAATEIFELENERCSYIDLAISVGEALPETVLSRRALNIDGLQVQVTKYKDFDDETIRLRIPAGRVIVDLSLIGLPDPDSPIVADEVGRIAAAIVAALDGYQNTLEPATNPPPATPQDVNDGARGRDDFARARSPFVDLAELVDLSDAPHLDADRLDELLGETYGDRAASFSTAKRECMSIEGAVAERDRGTLSSIVMPLIGRWCAPGLHADWWAEGDRIALEDATERACLAHGVFIVRLEAATGGVLQLTWPEPEAPERARLLQHLANECGLSEADAVRAGLVATTPLEPSAELGPYCLAVRLLRSARIPGEGAEKNLGEFEFVVETYRGVEAPEQIVDELWRYTQANERILELLRSDPMTKSTLIADPAYVEIERSYHLDAAKATLAEFNRVNCI